LLMTKISHLLAPKDAHKNLHFRSAKISHFMAPKDAHKNLHFCQ
jgi:hypothetical protein